MKQIKTIIKIAVIAMMGMSLGVNGQNNKIKSTGDVGIGTDDPKAKLDVKGDLKIGNSSTYTDLIFRTGTKIPGANGVFEILPKTMPGSGNARQTTYFKDASHGNGKTEHNVSIDGKVGIGTVNPSAKLEVLGDGVFRTTNNTNGLALHIRNTQGNNSYTLRAYNSKGQLKAQNGLPFEIQESYGKTWFYGKPGGNVGIGTTNPTAKLSVNGKIHTKEVRVDLNLSDWADFVFEKGYNLPTLKEVENHIKENGHLKDIPSAKEVEENGIYLGEMDAKLLQKIEELTLYTIEQEKKLKRQENKIKALEKENSKIDKQQKDIEELKVLLQKLLKDKN